MHIHPEMDALVRSLLSLLSMPNELRRLSGLIREIYQEFYRKALGAWNIYLTTRSLKLDKSIPEALSVPRTLSDERAIPSGHPLKHGAVFSALAEKGYRIETVRFTSEGASAWQM